MSRRTNSVPRDPIVRHVATAEVCIEALRACLQDADATASALTLPMLERLETSVATLAAALGGLTAEPDPAPVAAGTKKRRKAVREGQPSLDHGEARYPEMRTRSEVLESRRHGPAGGCCDRHADNKACDCLERARLG